jgi:hypothetical protein
MIRRQHNSSWSEELRRIMDTLEYIEDVSTWDSGGGTSLDLVRLKDGSILAISSESIVLYASEEDLEGGDEANRPSILRNLQTA